MSYKIEHAPNGGITACFEDEKGLLMKVAVSGLVVSAMIAVKRGCEDPAEVRDLLPKALEAILDTPSGRRESEADGAETFTILDRGGEVGARVTFGPDLVPELRRIADEARRPEEIFQRTYEYLVTAILLPGSLDMA